MRARRKLGLVLLGGVLGLVALEVALQVASFVLWRRSLDPAPVERRGDGDLVVLCVGDSFTEGLGASGPQHAYPRVAERLLGELDRDRAWRVFNCGRAGSNSDELLGKLPRQLADYGPDLVYVLTGYNDFWSRREPSDGFPIEVRTLRLLSLVARWFVADRGDREGDAGSERLRLPPDAPFLGEWHAGDVWLRFTAEGRIESSGGELGLHWRWAPERLVLHDSKSGERSDATWRLVDGDLVLSGAFTAGELRLYPGALLRDDVDRAAALVRAGEPGRAVEVLEASLSGELRAERRCAALRGLVTAHVRRGDLDSARACVARLRDGAGCEPLVLDAWFEVGDVDAAFAIVGRQLAVGTVDAALVMLVLRRGLEVSDRGALSASIDLALARGDLGLEVRLGLLGAKSALRPDDAELAVACLVEAYRASGDAELLHKTVREKPDVFTRERFAQRLGELGLEPAERSRVLAAYDAAWSTAFTTVEVLAGNLRRIVRTCREYGAEPVLLEYPLANRDVESVVAAIATELGIGRVAVRERFDAALAGAERSDFFVLDGHCNDRGYALLGELVARDALERLAARPR